MRILFTAGGHPHRGRWALGLAITLAVAVFQDASAEIKTVYVVAPSHLDIGFTAPPDTVARDCKSCIDNAIRLCEKYPDYFYTIECAWQLREWLNRSSPDEIRKLADLAQSGRVEIGGGHATMHSELMSGESVNRMFDLGVTLAKQLGTEIVTAVQDDVPGYTWAYPQAMRQHGIRFFLTGINTGFGGKPELSYKDVPFYWEGSDGSRVLTWIAFGAYADGNEWGVGLWERENAVLRKLPRQRRKIEEAGYPYDAFLIMASPGDNVDASATEKVHRIIETWNATGKPPILKSGTPRQFFEYMEKKYGDRFPTYRGDWSGHWAPAKLGAPRLVARMRSAQRMLPAAEALWSILALAGDARFPKEDIAATWDDLLTISEHSASAGTGWPNLTTKEEVIWENWQHAFRGLWASHRSNMLLQEGMNVLVNSLTADHPFIVAFNSFPWRRTGYVEVNLPSDVAKRGLLILENGDADKKIDWEMLEDGRTIRFPAEGVPGVGYKVFRVASGPAQKPPAATEATELDTRRFTVKVDEETGYIASIYDKQLQREWVERDRLLGALHLLTHAEAMMWGNSRPSDARASRCQAIHGRTYSTLRIDRNVGALVQTSITLTESDAVLRIENTLDVSRIPGDDRGGALLEFPLQLDPETLRIALDGPNQFRRWPEESLPGCARIGQALQSYAILRDNEAEVYFMPVEAPMVALGNAGWYMFDKPRKARVFSYLYDHGLWGENKDTGRTRYDEVEPALGTKISFTTYLRFGPGPQGGTADTPFVGETARRAALELTLPLFASFHSPWGKQTGKFGDAVTRGFLEIGGPNVELSSATPVSAGGGTFWQLRLQETAGHGTTTISPTVGFPLERAWTLDTSTGKRSELNVEGYSFSMELPPFRTATVLVEPKGEGGARK